MGCWVNGKPPIESRIFKGLLAPGQADNYEETVDTPFVQGLAPFYAVFRY